MERVLVVEDDNIIRNNIVEILRVYNYLPIPAENAKVALDLLSIEQPDIILCDVMMPEINGFEFLNHVSRRENLRNIPFLFLTAKTDPADVRMDMNLGADDYIIKPVTHVDLIKAIEIRLFKVRQLSEEIKAKQAVNVRDEIFHDREKVRLQLQQLSRSELRIVRLIAENMTSKDISLKLNNSVRTIENHRSNICKKLQFNGQNELNAFAAACRVMNLFKERANRYNLTGAFIQIKELYHTLLLLAKD